MLEATEEKLVEVVCNALAIAGQEMGDGDQGPVINATIHQIRQDWEAVKIERAVDLELKSHLYHQLDIMERDLKSCTVGVRAELMPKLKQLREVYDAYFADVGEGIPSLDNEEFPKHVGRARAILETLDEEAGE